MTELHGEKVNTVVDGVVKKGCIPCIKYSSDRLYTEASDVSHWAAFLTLVSMWHTCRYPDLQEAKTELEKEWLADLNAALGDNLEAHLHDPKGPSLPISIHFASKAPTEGVPTAGP